MRPCLALWMTTSRRLPSSVIEARLLDVTVRHHGAVNKTIGDAVMAAFPTPADAVRAALEMREAVEDLNRDRPQRDFILRIGVHRGAAIAVTLNDRLDYFGQTVNIAARVQNLAGGDEVCITEDVYQAPGVEETFAPFDIRRVDAELKGVGQRTPVYFVGGRPSGGVSEPRLRSA